MSAVTSELTLAELTAPTRRSGGISFVTRKRMYFNLLVANRFIDLSPVTRDVLWETADFRRQAMRQGRNLKLPDAIHVVTAIRSKCRYMMSSDLRLGPLPNEMKLLSAEAEDIKLVRHLFDA
jgi:predicted nucleic acid-binding protein